MFTRMPYLGYLGRGARCTGDRVESAEPTPREGCADQESVPTLLRVSMGTNDWKLTRREIDVLACLMAGKSNREIATELDLSPSTVKAHLTSLYRKLGVSSRMQASLVGLRILPALRPTTSRGTGSPQVM